MYLEAESIRLQTPIPGKPFAGIEVPKKRENRKIVHLGDFDIMRNVYLSLSSVLDKELLNPCNFLSARATRNIFCSNI